MRVWWVANDSFPGITRVVSGLHEFNYFRPRKTIKRKYELLFRSTIRRSIETEISVKLFFYPALIVKYFSMGESRGNFWKAFPLQRKKKVSIRPIAERQVLSAEMVADCTVSGKSTILSNKEALVHEELRRNQTTVKCFANTAYEDHGTFVSLSRIFKFESLKAHDVSKSHKTNISKFYATCANQGGQLQKNFGDTQQSLVQQNVHGVQRMSHTGLECSTKQAYRQPCI